MDFFYIKALISSPSISIISLFSDFLCFIPRWSNPTTITMPKNDGKMGNMSVIEVNVVMRKLGMNCEFGAEENGFDFKVIFEDEEPNLEEIWEVFKVFDLNRDGFIDAVEFSRVLCKLGLAREGSDVEMCKKMIRGFDRNGDGLLDFNDFLKLMEICIC